VWHGGIVVAERAFTGDSGNQAGKPKPEAKDASQQVPSQAIVAGPQRRRHDALKVGEELLALQAARFKGQSGRNTTSGAVYFPSSTTTLMSLDRSLQSMRAACRATVHVSCRRQVQ
jgi:hypothetical protein